MALFTARSLVGALECERSALVVIEQGRFPLGAVMARDAARNSILGKLLAMNVCVAFFALGRRPFEIDIGQPSFQIRRLVAIHASSRAMSSNQRKVCFGMVEARKLLP